jgi:PE family
MSYAIAAPDSLAAAAADLATIKSSLSAAHAAAAAPTVALVPAAADEVSASIAHLLSQDAKDYQAMARKVAAFHQQFIQHLNASARSYASTEAANTLSLRSLEASTRSHGSVSAGAQNQSPLSVTVPGRDAGVLLLVALLLLPVDMLLWLLTGRLQILT